ncbi:MAG: hypothetical protein C0620_13500 [Desulfuromonas sp.]|nr:MAG: hypothetical protein C0620_13500 [Desulfuromonas sp.]
MFTNKGGQTGAALKRVFIFAMTRVFHGKTVLPTPTGDFNGFDFIDPIPRSKKGASCLTC